MRFILLRHGETLWNVEQRLQGHENSELSERGRAQARQFAKYAAALNPKHIVSSDLGRTLETAELLGYANAPCDRRFRELNMGDWTGRTKPELMASNGEQYQRWRAGEFTPSNGEDWLAFRGRVADGIRDWLLKASGDVLAIVHSGVVRAACSEFLGLPPGRIMPTTPGAATVLRFDAPQTMEAKLEAYNLGALAPDEAVSD